MRMGLGEWIRRWRRGRGAQAESESPRRSDRVIHALVGRHIRYAFAAFDHPGMKVHRLVMPEGVEPDLLILPMATANAIAHSRDLIANLPDKLRARIASGELGVVLDSSNEATPHDSHVEAIRDEFLAALGASPRQAVYLTADRNYERDYLADCAARGVAEPIPVVVHDFWVWSFMNQFQASGADLFEQRLEAFRARARHRPRRFISLNFTPRPIKAMLLLSLMRDQLWDDGFISTGGFDETVKTVGKGRAEFKRRMAALPGFGDLAAELTPLLDGLAARGRVLFGPEENTGTAPMADVTLPEYRQSWFSLVTEPEMQARPTWITEKPLKPLVNFHPLIMFGSPGALRLIRDYGFQTFEGMVDEAYDRIDAPRARFDAAYAQVVRLTRMDEAQLGRLETTVAERLIHNARWGLTQFPAHQRELAHWALLDSIMGAVARAPA
jgi:hypothetical protein